MSSPRLAPEPSEDRVVAIGRQLASPGGAGGGGQRRARRRERREARGGGAGAYSMSPITRALMAAAMKEPAFQAAMFRLVDVLPAATDDGDVVAHLADYFEPGVAPRFVLSGVGLAGRAPGGRRIAAAVTRREVRRMAEQFIAGSDPAGIGSTLGEMWRSGTAATVDLLGEHTFSAAEADAYAARLAELVAALVATAGGWPSRPLLEADDLGPLPRIAVSIKPSALAPDFHPLTAEAGIAGARRRLMPILESVAGDPAGGGTAQVWFDMERFSDRHVTMRLFTEIMSEPSLSELHAGIVVQGYLRDSADDLTALGEWARRRVSDGLAPVGIRLVKGAYWDTETIEADAAGWPAPVWRDKAETDLNYEHCVRLLHGYHGALRAAFGSHNLRSLAYAMACAEAAGIAENGYEIQLLYGMAEPVHDAVRASGRRLRVYAPTGELVPGMAYLVRRLLENTSNEGFVRNRFAAGADLDRLLARPVPASRPTSLPSGGADEGEYRPEPLAEWHRAEVRQAMAAALTRARSELGRLTVPARIAGRVLETERRIQSVDPADPSTVVASSSCCSAGDLDAALAAAVRGARDWGRTPVAERAAVLRGAASWLRERRFDAAAVQVFEAGKTWAEADGDVCEAIDFLEYYARQAIELDGRGVVQSPPGETNRLTYHPRGPTAVISPWNFPLAIPTGMVAAALVTGNPVILKPAEQTPATAQLLATALAAGGVPDTAFALLPGIGEEIGELLATHPEIVTVVFTGSKAVGLHLNEIGARAPADGRQVEVRRVIAEMGGKNAIVVDTDADLDVAVPAILQSAFGLAGQRCSAASRVIAVDEVHDAVLERLVEAARVLKVGPPSAMGTEMGPVIDEDAVKRIRRWQERAGDFGRVALLREDLPERGYFVGPTIVAGVDPSSELAQTELFGPFVAVSRARSIDEAIAMANATPYALTAGIISRSPSNIRLAAEELRAGNVYVNRTIIGAVVGRQPFGGHGMSGFGQKAGGPDYLNQFVHARVVSENTMRQGFAPG